MVRPRCLRCRQLCFFVIPNLRSVPRGKRPHRISRSISRRSVSAKKHTPQYPGFGCRIMIVAYHALASSLATVTAIEAGKPCTFAVDSRSPETAQTRLWVSESRGISLRSRPQTGATAVLSCAVVAARCCEMLRDAAQTEFQERPINTGDFTLLRKDAKCCKRLRSALKATRVAGPLSPPREASAG